MMHVEPLRQRGFTLIETLVVLVMVSIICIGSYALLNNFNRTDQVLENRAEALRRYAMAMYRIGDDFRQLTVRPVKNGYNGYEPALRGDTDEIEFTRLGAANLTREPRGELQRLAYSTGYAEDADTSATDEEDAGALLLRSRWRVLDRAPDSEPVVEPLLEGVETLNFRYFDPDTEAWLSQWPPVTSRTSTAAADRSLPRAIELVLVTRSGGELRRVFNLPRVSASAGGQSDGADGAGGDEGRADDGEGTEDGQGEESRGGRDRE
ncbi:type II secretion system minor pseudopilin GspJ [Microbulbifer hainanensis]|uniref:type II secretion system minor pseudopilin GspJ n=1 Tax=Microbulbifer hainanensis TaxID=2735675 RepID=UPI001866BCB3|nr:type II secretion system minor pseudopilin GspJ [Microbulbifer hainanensis]